MELTVEKYIKYTKNTSGKNTNTKVYELKYLYTFLFCFLVALTGEHRLLMLCLGSRDQVIVK